MIGHWAPLCVSLYAINDLFENICKRYAVCDMRVYTRQLVRGLITYPIRSNERTTLSLRATYHTDRSVVLTA